MSFPFLEIHGHNERGPRQRRPGHGPVPDGGAGAAGVRSRGKKGDA
jgi:hypothetical protein